MNSGKGGELHILSYNSSLFFRALNADINEAIRHLNSFMSL